MNELRQTFKRFAEHPLSAPLALLALSLVCYGLYVAWMGFYWDDWPIAWVANISGAYGIRYFQFQRPLSGWVISLAAAIIGEVPLRWQLFTLGLRFLSGVAVWTLVKAIWPRRPGGALIIAAFFLVFPGFSQEFVSVNSAPHLAALILFTFSLLFMVQAERRRPPSWRLRGLALLAGLLSMLTTDYYYGLELARPLILWLAWDPREKKLGDLVKAWLPYMVLLAGVLVWHNYISQYGAYSLYLIAHFRKVPLLALGEFATTVVSDLTTATWGVWSSVFHAPNPAEVGTATFIYYLLLMLAPIAGLYAYLRHTLRETTDRRWGVELLLLGLIALLLGGIAFWVPGLPFKMAFPSDRLMLPMMLGSSLLLAGLLEVAVASTRAKAALAAILIGLAVGAQFRNALSYRVDWERQVDFYNQLTWRMPGLQPGTSLISDELPFAKESDNSLAGAVNWIFAPDFSAPRDYYDWEYRINPFISLPYMWRYLDLRLGWQLPPLEDATGYETSYRFFRFRGSSGQVLLVHYRPDACLRVWDPVYDAGDPQLAAQSELADYALEYTDLSLILTDPEQPARLPTEVLGPKLPHGWCYYFEQAELARQQGDWDEVVRLGGLALEAPAGPRQASELTIFIEGYARAGEWQAAEDLTGRALKLDRAVAPMLCAAWTRVGDAAGAGAQTHAAAQLDRLDCP